MDSNLKNLILARKKRDYCIFLETWHDEKLQKLSVKSTTAVALPNFANFTKKAPHFSDQNHVSLKGKTCPPLKRLWEGRLAAFSSNFNRFTHWSEQESVNILNWLNRLGYTVQACIITSYKTKLGFQKLCQPVLTTKLALLICFDKALLCQQNFALFFFAKNIMFKPAVEGWRCHNKPVRICLWF